MSVKSGVTAEKGTKQENSQCPGQESNFQISPCDEIIFQNLPYAALCLDFDHNIIGGNRHVNALFSADKDKICGSFISLISGWQRDLVSTALAGLESEPKRLQANLRSDISQGIRVDIRISRLPDNTLLVVLDKETAETEACRNTCRKMHILEAQYQHNPAGILLVNEKMEMLSFNREFLKMWSIPDFVQQNKDDNESLQTVLSQLKSPEKFLEKVHELYNKPDETSTDEIELLDGRVFYRHTYPIHNKTSYLGRVWYFLDITPLKQAQKAVQIQQQFQETVLEHIHDGIVACDATGKLTLFNRATKEIQGLDLVDIPMEQWSTFYKLYQPDGKTLLQQDEIPLVKAFNGQPVKNEEMLIISKQGSSRSLRVNGQAMYDGEGKKLGAVVSLHDITDLRMIKDELEHMAHHDCLTGLPNRILFHNLLEQCLLQANRIGFLVGILFLDLDNFKHVNDRFGHDAGDHLLRYLGQCLRNCLRDSDFLCRWGGDEFVIALPGLTKEEDVSLVAGNICSTVENKMKEFNPLYNITTSIGISVYPKHGRIADKLIRKADLAMFSAKKEGKNGIYYPSE